jgi:hypothetical protein
MSDTPFPAVVEKSILPKGKHPLQTTGAVLPVHGGALATRQ